MRLSSVAKLSSSAAALALLSLSTSATASNAFEVPDHGVEQFGRGGAWVARASDPMAAWFNPAALATQSSGVSLGVSLLWTRTCFNRVNPDGSPKQIEDSHAVAPKTRIYPETCNEDPYKPFPNPSLAGNFRVNDKLAIGLAVLGPHASGDAEWPDVVDATDRDGNYAPAPSPTRYLLIKKHGLILNPTLSVAYSVTPDLHFGAGFTWGIASLEFTAITGSLERNPEGWTQDIGADLKVKDWFVPGVVVGGLWEAHSRIDVGAWFRWSDAIKAKGDAYLYGDYYDVWGIPNEESDYCVVGNTKGPQNCTRTPSGQTKVRLNQPMEAKLGIRYHHPRNGVAPKTNSQGNRVRDPLAEDLFDIEVDFTYARNSVVENLEIRFPEGIELPWKGGATVPVNADVPHHFKDVFGVRVGGDYVILPNELAVRVGGFFETRGQDPAFANIDFVPAQRFGLTAGLTYRVGPVDINVAGGHVFGSKIDNEGQGDIPALVGTATSKYPSRTKGEDIHFRTPYAINDGWVQESVTIAQVGATYRF